MLTITVLYSCAGCGLTKTDLRVPARTEEDVVAWIEGLRPRIAEDHHKRSPHCGSELCDLMIPITGADHVGGAPVH